MPEKIPLKRPRTISSTSKGMLREAKTTTSVNDLGNGYIHMEKGVTKDMGDYNSARVTVGITLPIGATDEQVAQAKITISKANNLVEKILQQEVNALFE